MEAGGVSLSRPSDFQRAFWAAETTAAAAAAAAFSSPDPSALSAMRLVMLLDSCSLLLSSCFNTLCVGVAIVWLTYRAYLVLHKPLDELVGLLGFEIPQGPHVDLAGVKADGFVLHWKPADERKSTHRYEIQLNGQIIGQVSHSNTSIVISNLRPGQLYIVRVITVNSLDFRAVSTPIRLSTKPRETNDFFDSQFQADPAVSGPIVRPLQPFPDTSSAAPAAPPPLVREISNGPSQLKKSLFGRRPSPALPGLDTQHSASYEDYDEDGAGDSQQALTEKLDEIGRETAEIEKQIQDEEQEAIAAKATLVRERDELRGDLKEKDDTSRDLRKQVNALERNNQAAQNKKHAQERALQQKKNERQKLKDDAARWKDEIFQMRGEMDRISEQKKALFESTEHEKAELLEKQAQELQTLKNMEDENKEVGGQIKRLERDASNSPSNSEPNEYNDALAAHEADEDRFWTEKLRRLEEQYVIAHQNMDAARRFFFEANNQLAIAKQRHTELSQMASTNPVFDQPISRASSLRQRRPPSGPAATNASSVPGFPTTAPPGFSSGLSTNPPTSISPAFTTSAASFFNINNGMTFDRPLDDSPFSPSDIDKLTGGAPMSPSAGAELLPADLLSTADEEDPPGRFLGPSAHVRNMDDDDADSEGRHSSNQILPGLGALPGLGVLPGLGASKGFEQFAGPTSPGSVGSRSPSLFASPGASASNLAFNSPEIAMDSDRRSIRSSRSTRAASGSIPHSGSRFGQILGLDKLNRQRGKTLSDDGPALGSLPKSQSQSMPRQIEEPVEGAPSNSGRRRNSSLSAGNFFGSVLNRGSAHTKSMGAELPTQKNIAVRRRPFNMFSSKTDGWAAILGSENRPSSPRPGSTHSSELPRPSQDISAWGLWSSNEPFGQRSSPLSGDWMASPAPAPTIQHSLSWGSRHPSRRPSVQHGQTGGMPFEIREGNEDGISRTFSPPPLAPIGTKPAQMPQRPLSPKLNPAAKDFKSLFSRSDKRSKNKDNAVEGEEDLEDTHEASTPIGTPSAVNKPSESHGFDDSSPDTSRKSRDAYSFNTESSTNDISSRNSLDRSISYTPSETTNPSSSSNKESFMAKLTRKSSSGKFALPVFNREKKQKSSQRESMVEDDEDALARSVDSIPQKPGGSVRSWSSVFTNKMKRTKTEEQTPSLSGASLASEAGDDEGGDDGEAR